MTFVMLINQVLRCGCLLLGLPTHTFSRLDPSAPPTQPLERPTRGGSKRVDNSAMHRLLTRMGMALRYPTYVSGMLDLKSEYSPES